MSTGSTVRSAQTKDIQAWLILWRGYCAVLDGAVSDKVTEGVLQRILAPDEPIWLGSIIFNATIRAGIRCRAR